MALPDRDGDDALDPPRHFRCGSPRKGEEEDAPRIGAIDDQVGDAMGEGIGLARSRPGNDEQRSADMAADAVLDRPPLVGVELVQIGGSHRCESTA